MRESDLGRFISGWSREGALCILYRRQGMESLGVYDAGYSSSYMYQ